MEKSGYNNSRTNIYQLDSLYYNALKIQTKNHKINTEPQKANAQVSRGHGGLQEDGPLCFN